MRAKHMLHLEAVPAPFPCPLCPSQSELAGILTVQNPQTCCVCVKGTRSTEEGLLRPFQGNSPLQLLPRWPRGVSHRAPLVRALRALECSALACPVASAKGCLAALDHFSRARCPDTSLFIQCLLQSGSTENFSNHHVFRALLSSSSSLNFSLSSHILLQAARRTQAAPSMLLGDLS